MRSRPQGPELYDLLGQVDLRRGEDSLAVAELERAVDLSHRDLEMVADLAYAYAATRRPADARRLLPELDAAGAWMPATLAVLGQTDRAVAQLEEAYSEHRVNILYLRCFPGTGFANLTHVGSLSANPGFRALMKKIDFPPSS